MERRRLGRSGLEVSEIVLGTSQFGRATDEADARRMVDAYLDAGGTCIDTADAYTKGESERMLGRILRGRRADVLIATKVGGVMGTTPDRAGLSRRHILASIDESLERLQTDYVDLYQTHHWDPAVPIEESLEALAECVRAGKARAIGCSNLTGWQLATALGICECNGWPAFVSLQIEHSLLQRGSEIERFPACEYHGLGVLAWSPLGHGILTGKYAPGEPAPEDSRGAAAEMSLTAAQWIAKLSERTFEIAAAVKEVAAALGRTPAQVALRWNIEQPDVTAPIIGARTPEQLADNLGAVGWRLPEEHLERLNAVSEVRLPYPYISPRGIT